MSAGWIRGLVAAVWIAALLTQHAHAQVDWHLRLSSRTPVVRGGHNITYDSLRGRVVMYGGVRSNAPLYETWAWDGASWTPLVTRIAPKGAAWPGLAYATSRDRIVLFGGYVLQDYNDTWEFDGTEWHRMAPVHSPPVRIRPVLAYHAGIDKVVLFGGFAFADTWLWDGHDWTEVDTPVHPIARDLHAMAYDRDRQVLVLFGGRDIGAGLLGDHWEFDGNQWRQIILPTMPPPRRGHAMDYDLDRQCIVLYGYEIPNTRLWEYDGHTWTARSVTTPAGTGSHMVYHDGLRAMVAVSGRNFYPYYSTDVWHLETIHPATITDLGPGCTNPSPARIERDPHHWPWIGDRFDQRLVGTPSSDFGVLMLGLSDLKHGPIPLPWSLRALGLPGCSLRVSIDVLVSVPMSAGVATVSLSIPADPGLIGARLHEQALVHDPAAAAPGIRVTDAHSLIFGAR